MASPRNSSRFATIPGIVETDLFATVHEAFGMETIKSPLIEVEGTVEPFDNGKEFTLRILKVKQP